MSMNKKELPVKLTIAGNKIIDGYTIAGINESINEYLSNKYGYCINDYNFEITIKVSDISGDTDYDSLDEKNMKIIDYLTDDNTNWVSDMTISKEHYENLLKTFDLIDNDELRDLMIDYGFAVKDLFR